jgi:hypothetical protein
MEVVGHVVNHLAAAILHAPLDKCAFGSADKHAVGNKPVIELITQCCLAGDTGRFEIMGLLQIEWVIFAILRAIPVFNDDGIAMDDCRIGVARRSDSSGAAIEATSNSEAESTCRPHLIPIVSSQAHACKVWAFRPPPPAASDLTDAGAREELVPP